MSDEAAKGTSTRDTFRIERMKVYAAIVGALIAASSGWAALFISGSKHASEDPTTIPPNIEGHWELIANGFVFDLCIVDRDRANNFQGFLVPRTGSPTGTCSEF